MSQYTCKRCQLPTEREDQHDVFLCVTALKLELEKAHKQLAQLQREENKRAELRRFLQKIADSNKPIEAKVNEIINNDFWDMYESFGSPGDGEWKHEEGEE